MKSSNCPKCKVPLEGQELVGVEFETCPACSGVWLDNGELEAVTRSRGGNALKVELVLDKRPDYFCPRCQPTALLFEGEHSLREDFMLDMCQRCGGLWFDRGEFPSLLQNRR